MAPLHVEWIVGHVEAALELDVVVAPVDQWILCPGEQVALVGLCRRAGAGVALEMDKDKMRETSVANQSQRQYVPDS